MSIVYVFIGGVIFTIFICVFFYYTRRQEKGLRESEVKFRTLADFTFDWEYWGTPEGKYIYISPSCERITGYKPEEFIRDPDLLKSIIHPEDREFVFSHRQHLCPYDTGLHAVDFRILTKNGQTRWISHACQAVTDSKGNFLGRRVSNRDITERKRSEEDLKKAYEQLKSTQAQLIQSAKMASIGQMAGSIVHELKNPLVGILNNAQLIKMEGQAKKEISFAEIKDTMDIIESSAWRCNDVIQSLLGLARASKGVFQPSRLNELIERVMVIISKEVSAGNIAIKKELQADLPEIKGDIQLLQEIILVLISNAKWAVQKKWKQAEGGLIAIRTFQEPQKKSVILSVSDNGIGIPQENIPKLFEPFFTTKEEGEGTGLGLALVSDIVRKHEGNIAVKSTVNAGTEFTINFPL